MFETQCSVDDQFPCHVLRLKVIRCNRYYFECANDWSTDEVLMKCSRHGAMVLLTPLCMSALKHKNKRTITIILLKVETELIRNRLTLLRLVMGWYQFLTRKPSWRKGYARQRHHCKMAVGRHLGYYQTANNTIRSTDPENPCLEPDMECIGRTVCEIFAFKLYCDLETGVRAFRGHSRSSKTAPLDWPTPKTWP